MRSRKNPGRSPGWAFSKGIGSGHEAGLDVLNAGVDTEDQFYGKVRRLLEEQRKDPSHIIYEFGDYGNAETLLKHFERGENQGANLALKEWKEYLLSIGSGPARKPPSKRTAPVRETKSSQTMSQAEVKAILAKIEAEAAQKVEEYERRMQRR